MFFEIVILALLSFEAISSGNANETKVATSTHSSSDPANSIPESIANDVNEAKELFKRNYERRYKVIIDDIQVETKSQVFKKTSFTSGILRLLFSFDDRGRRISSSVLLKVPKLGPMYLYGVNKSGYPKESFMYKKVIPRMYKKVPYEKLSPKFYGSTSSNVLILEDLRRAGYKLAPKSSLVGLAECEAVWKTLAQFHALSTRPLDDLSADLDSLTSTGMCQEQWMTKDFPALFKNVKKNVLPHFSQGVNTFFDNFLKDFCPKWIEPAFAPNKFGPNVIVHGDAHLSNVLFKHGNNGVKCKFTDFQNSHRGSAVVDLMHFTISSVRSEVFGQHRERLFSLYVEEFNGTLEKIGVAKEKFRTLDAFKSEWEKYREYYFFVLIGVCPPFWAGVSGHSSDKKTAVDELIESGRFKSAFEGWIKHLIPSEHN